MNQNKPLQGETFGRWTVVGETLSLGGRSAVPCLCACGTERIVLVQSLRRKDRANPSCGCWRREQSSDQARRQWTKHGRARGSAKDPLYKLWQRINRRCHNPRAHNYRWYGARGIEVWGGWRNDPAAFIDYVEEYLGPRPAGMSLDRIDNDGNYTPGNLKWSTAAEQVRNSRICLRDHCTP